MRGRNLLGWAFLLVLLVALVAAFQLFRFEYTVGKRARVDRFTGTPEIFCDATQTWLATYAQCSDTESALPETSKSQTSGLKTDNVIKEIYVKRGWLCLDRGSEFFCGRDKDNSGVLEPWEYPWIKHPDGSTRLRLGPPTE